MTLREYIVQVRDPSNWTPEFFEQTEALFINHLDTVRRTLVKDKLWEQFDEARCEWKLQGQAKAWEGRQKAVPDKGRFRPAGKTDSSEMAENGRGAELKTNSKGAVLQTIGNCIIAISGDEHLREMFRYNELSDRTEVTGAWWKRSSESLSDSDVNHIRLYLEQKYGLSHEKNIPRAIDIIAHQHSYHPIRELLTALKWDGKKRIENLLPRYLGAEKSEYTAQAMKLFMLGAISRVFTPGIKFELMLCVVENRQGGGKSTLTLLLEILQNVLLTVGNIADRLNEAWNTGEIGTQIIQNLFDLFNIILETIREITGATAEWAATLDFTPLLRSINGLLEALKPLTENIGAGLAWFWENVLLPIAGWTIQEAVPAFLDLLSAAIGTVNEAIEALKPLGGWLFDTFLKPLGEWTGDLVIAALKTLTDLLNGFGDWISEHQGIVEAFTVVIGSFMAAWGIVNLAVTIGGIISALVSFVTTGGLVTAAVTALGGACDLLIWWGSCEQAVKNRVIWQMEHPAAGDLLTRRAQGGEAARKRRELRFADMA